MPVRQPSSSGDYSLRLLGSPVLEGPSGPVPGRTVPRQRMALLALLGTGGVSGLSRDKVIGLLWPDRSETDARHLLANAVYRLRKELGEDAITTDGEMLQLDAVVVRVDVQEFLAALADDDLQHAIEMYSGPFMDGFHLSDASREFEEWFDRERSRLDQDYDGALELQAVRAEAGGNLVRAVDSWRRLMRHDPANSRVALRLMRALAEAGDVANAIEFAAEHERYLHEALDLEPPTKLLDLVETLQTAPESVRTPPGLESRPRIRALAVLPLDNLSGEGDEHFTDGMTEALIGEIGRIGAVERVISRTSAMHFRDTSRPLPEIARELNVDAVVEGSVLRAADDVRITLRLVHCPTDRLLWSEEYVGKPRDVIPLQRRVSRDVAERIRTTLSPAERRRLVRAVYAPDPGAFEAYLKGRHHFNRWGIADAEQAIRHYQEAIALDPEFAPAHAALAEVCVLLPPLNVTSLDVSVEECERMAVRALELDEELSEAHTALALVRNVQWDWSGAETEFRRAIELNPSSLTSRLWYGLFLTQVLRLDEALVEAGRAEELDPLNLLARTLVAGTLMNMHRYDEGLVQLDEVLRLDPDYGVAFIYKSALFNLKGMPEQGLESASQAARRVGNEAAQVLMLKAWSHALTGEQKQAMELLSRMEDMYGKPWAGAIAVVLLTLGREDEALDKLEQGLKARAQWLPNVTSMPHLDGLRNHPRFRRLRREMKLP